MLVIQLSFWFTLTGNASLSQQEMSLVSVCVDLDRSPALDRFVLEVQAETFLELFEDIAEVSRGVKPLHGDRPVQFKKSIPAKDSDGQLSVRFFVASERDGTRMEVSPGLKVAECC